MTPAQKFAADMQVKVDGPADFTYNGSSIASVNPDGSLHIIAADLPQDQAAALVTWLTAIFVTSIA